MYAPIHFHLGENRGAVDTLHLLDSAQDCSLLLFPDVRIFSLVVLLQAAADAAESLWFGLIRGTRQGGHGLLLDKRETPINAPVEQCVIDRSIGRYVDMGGSVMTIHAVHALLFGRGDLLRRHGGVLH